MAAAVRTAGPFPAISPLSAYVPPNTPRHLAVFVGVAVGNGASPDHSLYHPPYKALTNAIKNARECGMIVTRDTVVPPIVDRINDFINIVRSHPSSSRYLGDGGLFDPQLHSIILAAVLHVMDSEEEE